MPSKDSMKAKDIIYPAGGSLEEKPEVAEMYKRTHANFGYGEQRTREYDWSTNPTIDNRP